MPPVRGTRPSWRRRPPGSSATPSRRPIEPARGVSPRARKKARKKTMAKLIGLTLLPGDAVDDKLVVRQAHAACILPLDALAVGRAVHAHQHPVAAGGQAG